MGEYPNQGKSKISQDEQEPNAEREHKRVESYSFSHGLFVLSLPEFFLQQNYHIAGVNIAGAYQDAFSTEHASFKNG